jgi:putative peptidoglycan lipid II flippase
MSDGSPRLARSAGVIGLATMTSRLLGLVREQVQAFLFGAGDSMDAFLVAFRIPNLVRDLFAEGAMSAAFVPTLTRTLGEGRERAWRLANSVINALLIVTGVIALGAIVFAGPLVAIFASDFAAVPGKFELTVRLTRIMVPFLTLVAIAAALMGILNSLNRFFLPALSPAMFNVGSIVCALALVPLAPALGFDPIMALAVGALVGGLGQAVIQVPALYREGFTYQPVLDWRDEGLRHMLLLMAPGTVGLAATQINVFVNTILATGEGTGAVSWLNYAFRLMYLPIGLFGVSIATATTPAVARLAAGADLQKILATVGHAISLMLFLNLPATLGLVVLAQPIVRLIFEHGSFTAADTIATAAALQCYAAGLIGYSVVRIVSPTFYALGRSRIPVMISVGSVVLNVVLNLTLVRVMGYRGLALGTSITALLNAAAQLWFLRREIHGVDGRRVLSSAVRVLLASLVMAAVAWAAADRLEAWLPGEALAWQAARLGASIAIALAALAAAAAVLRIPEFEEARALLWGRFSRTRRP